MGKQNFLFGLGVAIGTLGMVFLAPLITTVLGAFSGWVVGLFFSDTILGFLAAFGLKGVALWQVGASLGFLGGFLRPKVFNNNSNN